VSIVSNDPDLAPSKIIWLMFNRWVQENDFAYLRRHFGIGELSGRGFDTYAEIADQLEDRQVESREHKKLQAERGNVKQRLGKALVRERDEPPLPAGEELEAEREKLQERVEELTQELAMLVADQRTPLTLVHRLQEKVQEVKGRFTRNRELRDKAAKRRERENVVRELTAELERVEARLAQIPKTESRVQALVEEGYVRLSLNKKRMMDAIRVTCRNVFIQPFRIFRAEFGDHRDDHVILRRLTRSAGFIIARDGCLEVYLTPRLALTPSQAERVRAFLSVCEHRARQQFGDRALPLRFHLVDDKVRLMRHLFGHRAPGLHG